MNRTNGSASGVNESASEAALPDAPTSTTNSGSGRRGRQRKGGKGRLWIVSTVSLTFLLAVTISSLIPIYFYHATGHHELVGTMSSDAVMINSLREWKLAVNITKSDNNLQQEPDRNLNTDVIHPDALLVDATELKNDSNPLLRVLLAAGVSVEDINVDRLPRVYQDMTSQYGDMQRPVVFGMDTCSSYQQAVPKQRRIVAVAGMFNTGTNAMEYHLRENLSGGIRSLWQVPWGKHRVPYVRLQHVAPGMAQIQQEDVLPIIMIRDPFHWMQSMCKSPYAAHWKKTRLHCPNLVPTAHDLQRFEKDLAATNHTFNVTVIFDTNQIIHWKSLIDLYNDWYRQYFINATYPRLIVRFEDMLLHAPTILRIIGRCAGVDASSTFKYQVNSAKQHGSHTDFMNAILKSGNLEARIRNMTSDDVQFAVQNLDPYLMETMHYQMPQSSAV
jgi:hypothetical protein